MKNQMYPTWTSKLWYGNPLLNLQCNVKTFANPYNNRKVNVWIHGGTNEYPGYSFTVSAGANSEYSYTGFCVNCNTISEACNYVDSLSQNKKLFK